MLKLINHPFRLAVIGKSQGGKTTFAVKVIEYLIPQVDEVYITSPTYELQETWNPVRPFVTVYHDGPVVLFKALHTAIVNEIGAEDHKVGKPLKTKRLLICDDVSYEKALNEGNKGIFNGFAYNAVWYNLSMVVIVHKSSNIGAGIKENCDGLALFNVVQKEMKPLFDTFGITSNFKQFRELIHKEIKEKITSGEDKYPFLYYDLKNEKLYFKMREELMLE